MVSWILRRANNHDVAEIEVDLRLLVNKGRLKS